MSSPSVLGDGEDVVIDGAMSTTVDAHFLFSTGTQQLTDGDLSA